MQPDNDCIFCRIAGGEVPADKVYEDDDVLAFRDIQQAAPVHVLVITRKHIPSLAELGGEQPDVAAALLRACALVAENEGVTERGYRVVTNVGEWGGQTVHHLHFHVLSGRQLHALG